MAVDTRDRRAATINLALPFAALGPNPSGSLASAADRELMGRVYNGIVLTDSLPAGRTRKRRHSLGLYSAYTPPYLHPFTHPVLPEER